MYFKYFSVPSILQQIGVARLQKFLAPFADELNDALISLPEPPPGQNGAYFDNLSAMFGLPGLPEELRSALKRIEAAASPENQSSLEKAIERMVCFPNDPAAVIILFAFGINFNFGLQKEVHHGGDERSRE